MRVLPKEAWNYALLLIILFAMAVWAAYQAMLYVNEHVPIEHSLILSATIWTLTLGFVFIAGAFGLWTVRFAASGEARRRMGRLVDTMDYLRDGVLLLDRKGKIAGSNPALRGISGCDPETGMPAAEALPFLSETELDRLKGDETAEFECTRRIEGSTQVLRFRAQPADGLRLVLISDITAMNTQRARARRAAKLQLIGQLARGVAHDLDRLLCGISGNASLLARVAPNSAEGVQALRAIHSEARRGMELACNLKDLARPLPQSQGTELLVEHVGAAAEGLRDALAPDWQVHEECDALPPVALTGLQIEQIVLNLGLLAADALSEPGQLVIRARPPGADRLTQVDSAAAGALVVLARPGGPEQEREAEDAFEERPTEDGVILSVVRSLVEESGGKVKAFASKGAAAYQVELPITGRHAPAPSPPVSSEIEAFMSGLSLLLAFPAPGRRQNLEERLTRIGAKVECADNISAALSRIESEDRLDAAVIDDQLLRQATEGLLRAILKLRPLAGIVVVCEEPAAEPEALRGSVVFVPKSASVNTVLLALIEARGLAVRRQP